MTGLMRNALTGRMDYTSAGKLAALFLAALIYLWLSGKWKEKNPLFIYASVAAICCLTPVTAAVLMQYQTRFYDYVWLWSLVPVTAVTAWAAVEAGVWLREKFRLDIWKRQIPVAALFLAVLALCGGLGEKVFDPAKEKEERQKAGEVLALVEALQEGELCLWAPREILKYVRESDSSVRLIYGRNMWDISLGAYIYDVYPEEMDRLYLWIENTDESGLAEYEDEEKGKLTLRGDDCIAAALEAGANSILLPGHLEPAVAEELAEAADAEFSRLGEYYFLKR